MLYMGQPVMNWEKIERVDRDLWNRETWEKYRSRYYGVIINLEWADEVARQVTERTGVDMIHYVPQGKFKRSVFHTYFNAKEMSQEEKMKEISRSLDAVDQAFSEKEDIDKGLAFSRQQSEKRKTGRGRRKTKN